jgi:hypothetical protein
MVLVRKLTIPYAKNDLWEFYAGVVLEMSGINPKPNFGKKLF